MAYTTTELLSQIRSRARLPESDPDFTDAALLDLADQTLDEVLVPVVLAARSDYYVTSEDQSLVSGQAGYTIPSRAVASVPRQVFLVQGTESRELDFVPLADRHRFSGTGQPVAYTVQDDQVLLFPTPSAATETLRIVYEYQPSKLVTVANAVLITDIDTGTLTVEGDVPTTWTTGDTIDLIRGSNPFSVLQVGLGVAAITATPSGDITFDVAMSDRLAVGDWAALEGTTPVPQIPADFHSLLALATTVEVLDLIADPIAGPTRMKLERAIMRAEGKLSPRVKQPQKIVSRNSFLRRKRGAQWGGY